MDTHIDERLVDEGFAEQMWVGEQMRVGEQRGGVQVRAGRLPHLSDQDWVLVEPNALPPAEVVHRGSDLVQLVRIALSSSLARSFDEGPDGCPGHA